MWLSQTKISNVNAYKMIGLTKIRLFVMPVKKSFLNVQVAGLRMIDQHTVLPVTQVIFGNKLNALNAVKEFPIA